MRAMEPAAQTLERRAPQRPHDREGHRDSDQIAREIEHKDALPSGLLDIEGRKSGRHRVVLKVESRGGVPVLGPPCAPLSKSG